jgi:hypothetical protein
MQPPPKLSEEHRLKAGVFRFAMHACGIKGYLCEVSIVTCGHGIGIAYMRCSHLAFAMFRDLLIVSSHFNRYGLVLHLQLSP